MNLQKILNGVQAPLSKDNGDVSIQQDHVSGGIWRLTESITSTCPKTIGEHGVIPLQSHVTQLDKTSANYGDTILSKIVQLQEKLYDYKKTETNLKQTIVKLQDDLYQVEIERDYHMNMSKPAFLQDSLSLPDLRSRIGPAPVLSKFKIKPSYFCNLCKEEGNHKQFGGKVYWRRHMDAFHKEYLQWRCNKERCGQIFRSKSDCGKHTEEHGAGVEPVLSARLYACGFERCGNLYEDDYEQHLKHVIAHMERGDSEWSYSVAIRTLLRHWKLSVPWEIVCAARNTGYNVTKTELHWDRAKTVEMKKRLELFDFGGDFVGFLDGIFLAGSPN
ncbi:homeobox and c2h2 transcription [Paraphaeosphaeria sporulosa]